jgi:hypothetical protein
VKPLKWKRRFQNHRHQHQFAIQYIWTWMIKPCGTCTLKRDLTMWYCSTWVKRYFNGFSTRYSSPTWFFQWLQPIFKW